MKNKISLLFFWVKLLFLTMAIGTLMFFLTLLIFKNMSVPIFLGIALAYGYLGVQILMHATGKKLYNFLRLNVYLSLAIIFASILLLLLLPAKILGILLFVLGFNMLFALFMIGHHLDRLDKKYKISPIF
jgi:hypothetical protein